MLSQKARYALRAMIELARENGQVTAGELAVRADAPRKFLEAILLTLSRQGLVTSRRGKFGGYLLGREPAAIYFFRIFALVCGSLSLAPCVGRKCLCRCEACRDLATCALREALLRARDATAAVLEGYSLADAAAGSGAEMLAEPGS